MENIDGFYRLQVERYESLELNDVEVSITHINEQSKNYVLKQDVSGVIKIVIIPNPISTGILILDFCRTKIAKNSLSALTKPNLV